MLVQEMVGWVRGNWGAVRRDVRDAAAEDGDEEEEENKERDWKGLIGCCAQKHLEGSYGTLGLVRDAGMGEWEEGGVPRVGMLGVEI